MLHRNHAYKQQLTVHNLKVNEQLIRRKKSPKKLFNNNAIRLDRTWATSRKKKTLSKPVKIRWSSSMFAWISWIFYRPSNLHRHLRERPSLWFQTKPILTHPTKEGTEPYLCDKQQRKPKDSRYPPLLRSNNERPVYTVADEPKIADVFVVELWSPLWKPSSP